MRIGIDCRTIGEPAGIGEYTRQIVKYILRQDNQNDLVLFFADAAMAANYRQANVTVKILPLARYKRYLPFVYQHFLVPLYLLSQGLDVCWFPANIIPLAYWGKSVVTIHDLAVYKFPELFPDQKINFDRRILVPMSLRRASKIIAVSESTKRDIIELFKIDQKKISVVYEGGDFEFDPAQPIVWPKELEPRKYFLFVGTIEPRKNLQQLIDAYSELVRSGQADYNLVLAGKSGWKNEDIFKEIETVNREFKQEKIKYLGFVTNEQKALLYQNAFALVLPSIYEGFGLPAAEALQFGLPLILSRGGALPEIGGSSAIYVDANSKKSILEALRQLCVNQSLYEQLARQALNLAQGFIWRDGAEGVLKTLKSV